MEWLDALQGQVVGLDTAPLIYLVEENSTYLDIVHPFFVAMDQGEFNVVTSTVTLLEVLVHPLRLGKTNLAQQYRDILLNAENLMVLSLSQDIAEGAARLRALYDIRTPDAIQMATAICARAFCLLTNDARLPPSPQLDMLILDDLKTK